MRALAQRHRWQPCRISGCTRPRDTTSAHQYCPHHSAARRKYGHPLGRRIYRKDYVAERKEVDTLFAEYPEHKGVRAACAWVQRWLDASTEGDKKQPGYIHVARLARWNVSALDIVAEVCSVWHFIQRRGLPDDERATFALAVAMLFLAPKEVAKGYSYPKGEYKRYREANYADRKAIGDHLRLNLVELLVNVHMTLEAQQQAERDAKDAMREPFTSSTEGVTAA